MDRMKMLCWVLAAFITIIAGVHVAFDANKGMTGATDIPRPLEYRVEGQKLQVSFLGQAFYLGYPKEEVSDLHNRIRKLAAATARWAREEAEEIRPETSDGLKDN